MRLMARGGTPNDLRIFNLHMARIINNEHGAAVVDMWSVNEMRETDIDFFLTITAGLKVEKERRTQIDRLFADFENRHPTFRKRQ